MDKTGVPYRRLRSPPDAVGASDKLKWGEAIHTNVARPPRRQKVGNENKPKLSSVLVRVHACVCACELAWSALKQGGGELTVFDLAGNPRHRCIKKAACTERRLSSPPPDLKSRQ